MVFLFARLTAANAEKMIYHRRDFGEAIGTRGNFRGVPWFETSNRVPPNDQTFPLGYT